MATSSNPVIPMRQGKTLFLPIRCENAAGELLTYEGTELRSQLRQRLGGGGQAQLSFSTEDDTITHTDGTEYLVTDSDGDPVLDENDDPVYEEASFVLHATATAMARVSIEDGWIDVEAVNGPDDVDPVVDPTKVRIKREVTR